MACYDTDANGRSEYTEKTLISLAQTVDWSRNRLVVVDNGSCSTTKGILKRFEELGALKVSGNFGWKIHGMKVITNTENLGTARAVNQGLRLREPGEYCVKIDNDVVIHSSGWVQEMGEAMERCPEIGVLGLKRKDLAQYPTNPNLTFRSEMVMLPHETGQKWIYVEKSADIIGTCTMLNWRLLDKVGFMWQPGLYGFDDQLMALRSTMSGFWNAFLSHIEIEHIDTGSNPYSAEKVALANEVWGIYTGIHNEYLNGTRDIYYDGE